VFVTAKGMVKRTALPEYYTTRSTAIAAIKLGEGDEVVEAAVSDGRKDMLLITRQGMSIRFPEDSVKPMGRNTAGVKGIQLYDGDTVAAAVWVRDDEGELLLLTDRGYAKRTLIFDYMRQNRGGRGMLTFEFKTGKKAGANGTKIVAAFLVKDAFTVSAAADDGSLHTFSSEDAVIEERRSAGKPVVKLAAARELRQAVRIFSPSNKNGGGFA
jgi:topoisomerase-4 subunit A